MIMVFSSKFRIVLYYKNVSRGMTPCQEWKLKSSLLNQKAVIFTHKLFLFGPS